MLGLLPVIGAEITVRKPEHQAVAQRIELIRCSLLRNAGEICEGRTSHSKRSHGDEQEPHERPAGSPLRRRNYTPRSKSSNVCSVLG